VSFCLLSSIVGIYSLVCSYLVIASADGLIVQVYLPLAVDFFLALFPVEG